MKDYLDIGPTPSGESCEQVGTPSYNPAKARKECEVFRDMIRRLYPKFAGNVQIKSFPHDFGTYSEVVVYYDSTNQDETEYAYEIEGNTPENWDEQAARQIASFGNHLDGIFSVGRVLDNK